MGINARKQNLKKMLEEYSAQKVQLYEKYEEMPTHSFSDDYREKMRNLVEQPVQKTKHTFVYRFAMICVCVIVTLLIVNQASAYVFGMTLWDKLMESAPQEMITTIYQGNGRNKKGSGETTGKERVHDIPTEIPEGYELVSETNNERDIFAKWQSDNSRQLIFTAYDIRRDVRMYENGEWETESVVEVMGNKGKLYTQTTHIYLFWDDEKYHNNIIADNIPREQLLAVAESLYEE